MTLLEAFSAALQVIAIMLLVLVAVVVIAITVGKILGEDFGCLMYLLIPFIALLTFSIYFSNNF